MEELQAALEIAFKVLLDWRVIFITVAVLLAWSALRYVGIVYHKKPRGQPKPKIPTPQASARPKAGKARAKAASATDSGDEGLVE
jgi:hypothetical protein